MIEIDHFKCLACGLQWSNDNYLQIKLPCDKCGSKYYRWLNYKRDYKERQDPDGNDGR
jgi:hypothetical protein